MADPARVRQRHLDDVEPVTVLERRRKRGVPARGCVVDQYAAIREVGNERQRVRAAARHVGLRSRAELDVTDQLWILEVRDVEYVHALEALGDRLAVAGCPGGRRRIPSAYEDVAPHDDVALVALTARPADLLRVPRRPAQDPEPDVVSVEHQPALEGEVG